MPVVKLRGSCTPDVMKSEWGNDSLNTFTRRATGKEPFLSLPRTADNPLQWIQLLNALDQQDHPGWPLLSPLKVQLQKCDKCSREFCSTINYRRHIRVHRRSLNVVKDFHKNRDLLGAFWDKLSLDKAKEVLSLKDVTLEEVTGSSIIRALTSFIRKPEFYALPQPYAKAGSALLDIIQARPSGLPISSLELFSILDDASERTFLCAGTAESIQKYVFDGETGKIGLEMKNLVACTCFLVEQKLVKAWLADKDAEALRCQKLLVEEVEADQKRQAELLERKRQKKLRQKEQKTKEQANSEKEDLKEINSGTLEGPSSAETSSPSKVESDSSSNELETPVDHAVSPLESVQSSITEDDTDTEAQNGFSSEHTDSGTGLAVDRKTAHRSGHRHLVLSRWQVPKSQRGGRNGFHASENTQVLQLEPLQKRGGPRDLRAAPVVNSSKVWTRKPKSENDGENLKFRLQKEVVKQTDQNCEVMIGSISVTLGDSAAQQQGGSTGETLEHCMPEHPTPKNGAYQEKPIKTGSVQGGGSNRSTVKLWRPVSRHETRGPLPVQSGSGDSREEVITTGKDNDRTKPSESCVRSCASGGNANERGNDSHPLMEESTQPEGLMFSSHAAEAFLSERWKEAISADHVRLVLTPQSDTPGTPDTENDNQLVVRPPDSQSGSKVGDSEKLLGNAVAFESSTTGEGTGKSKFRTQPEKAKTKYIPKQRTIT